MRLFSHLCQSQTYCFGVEKWSDNINIGSVHLFPMAICALHSLYFQSDSWISELKQSRAPILFLFPLLLQVRFVPFLTVSQTDSQEPCIGNPDEPVCLYHLVNKYVYVFVCVFVILYVYPSMSVSTYIVLKCFPTLSIANYISFLFQSDQFWKRSL